MNEVVEKHIKDNLFHDYDVIPVVEKYEFTTGTYKRGQLLEKHSDGKLKACTVAANLFAVCTDDVVIDTKTTKATVYLTGCFNKNAIDISSLTLKDLQEAGRKFQIYFR